MLFMPNPEEDSTQIAPERKTEIDWSQFETLKDGGWNEEINQSGSSQARIDWSQFKARPEPSQ